jgi:hypothetical protein
MKKNTLLLLGIIGLGYYLYYRNKKSMNVANNVPTGTDPNAPVNDTGVPNEQRLNSTSYRAYFSLSGYKKLGNIPNTI